MTNSTENLQAKALELLDVFDRLTYLPTYNHADLAAELRASIDRENALRAEVGRLRGFFIYVQDGAMGGLNVQTLGQLIASAPASAFTGRRTARENPDIPSNYGVPNPPSSISRIDVIGQNGNDGEHYGQESEDVARAIGQPEEER